MNGTTNAIRCDACGRPLTDGRRRILFALRGGRRYLCIDCHRARTAEEPTTTSKPREDAKSGADMSPPTPSPQGRSIRGAGFVQSTSGDEMAVALGELDDLLDLERGLTDWEVNFIDGAKRRLDVGVTLTPPMIAKLHEIWDRTCT